MKFGFIIDNRKCIGCHACTTACKAEHMVPVGVNRTYVKYVEKGKFPDTRRLFSVMRCNHCTNAPCVTICPVEALFIRQDGIVDFNNKRCIGCKSCMQACPYDALYIDPNTSTAAKCNYCAHRVDVGLEPACVNVCPEHAIISGDMHNPNSEISQLLARQQVTVRKPEKGTKPNLFYIDGDQASLDPLVTPKSVNTLWSNQARGVGHFAKKTEKLAFTGEDVVFAAMAGTAVPTADIQQNGADKSIDVLMNGATRNYDQPDKGILWGWEVSGYVVTKAISAGVILVMLMAYFGGFAEVTTANTWWGYLASLFFLTATGALLVKDLDQPTRFLNVLLRPQWGSWLVRGGYSITIFGGLVSLVMASKFFDWGLETYVSGLLGVFAIIVAIYTAFLFAQAKGRDFWQSPSLAFHMLLHSVMAGAAFFAIISLFVDAGANWLPFLRNVMVGTIVLNLFTLIIEMTITHPTEAAKQTVHMILSGRYKNSFWGGVVLFGNILPLAMLLFAQAVNPILAIVGIILLIGSYLTEKIWVEAPQRMPLT